MSRHLDFEEDLHGSDAKRRRQLKDERRMRFRRAIENYAEQRQLHQQLADFPDLISPNQRLTA
jgi:hypothetical protein